MGKDGFSQRTAGLRSLAHSGSWVRDPVQEHYGMTLLHVILTCFLSESLSFAKNGAIGAGQSLFSLSSSRERSKHLKCDLSRLFRAFSVQRFMGTRSRTGALRDDRRGVRRGRLYGTSILLPSRHPDNASGQDLGLCRVFETRSRAKASRDDRRGALLRIWA